MTEKIRARHLKFVTLVYRMRKLGSALGALPVASVLYQQHAPAWPWGLMLLNGLVWPHVAYAIASRAEHPRWAEQRNFLFDATMTGVWVALMRFNLLPSAMLVAMLAMNHVSAGGWLLLRRSLIMLALTCLLVGAALDFPVQPVSNMLNTVACLPLLIINPVWLSKVNFTLGQRVREQNRLLDKLNRTDALTELPNRTHWLEDAGKAWQQFQRNRRPASLLLLDIDNFKQINDHHGHAAGDALLRQLATVLHESLREMDTPGRLGGDEFGVVLSGTDGAHALAVAERVRNHIEQARSTDSGGQYAWTVSVGVAEINDDTGDVAAWVQHADMALYRAKLSGRNRVCQVQPGPAAGAPPPSAVIPSPPSHPLAGMPLTADASPLES